MAPAQQRFGVGRPLRAQVHLGLVDDFEFAAFAGLAQVADQADLAQVGLVPAGLVDGHALVRLLRFVHGDVGAPQQGVGGVRVRGVEREADAGADADLCLPLRHDQR